MNENGQNRATGGPSGFTDERVQVVNNARTPHSDRVEPAQARVASAEHVEGSDRSGYSLDSHDIIDPNDLGWADAVNGLVLREDNSGELGVLTDPDSMLRWFP